MGGLVELYKSGMMAPIINTGSTHETRSHFDAQDFMEWADTRSCRKRADTPELA